VEHVRVGQDVFVRLDKGEELHASIRRLGEQGISTAAITSGIGRLRDTVIGFLDEDGVYQKMAHNEPMELLSMQGSLAPGPEGAFSHIHIVCSDNDHVVRGGHLFEAFVEVTAEIHLRVLGDERYPFQREQTGSEFLRISFCEIGD
tara:strand:+ start:3258 stop:3695 length:438 start_codon:yes stop_codon:yes gene_type:complete